MSNITYANKNNSKDGSPESQFTADNANEVKEAVNSKQDGNANTSALAGLSGTGFVKKTGAGTFIVTDDTNTLFYGSYISLAALQLAHPTGEAGAEARVDPGIGTDAITYIWDVSDNAWVEGGGTGASTFSEIGGSPYDNANLNTALNGKQPLDDDLTAIAGLSPADNDFMQRKAGVWTNRTPAQVKVDLAINNVDNTADANKPVSTAQGTAISNAQTAAQSYTDNQKGASGGIVAMSGFSIAFKNLANTITSLIQNAATAIRTYTFPDKNITVAGLDDITAALILRDSKVAAYTLQASDSTKTLTFDSATDIVITVPVLVASMWVSIINKGTGAVTFLADTGATVTIPGAGVLRPLSVATVFYDTTSSALVLIPSTPQDSVRTIAVITTQTGNATTVETNLLSYTIRGNTIGVNGESAHVVAMGRIIGNINNKTLKAYFGATTFLDTGALAIASNASWVMRSEIIRLTSTSQRIVTDIIIGSTVLPSTCLYVAGTENLATDLLFRITGTGGATNDIFGEAMKLTKGGI